MYCYMKSATPETVSMFGDPVKRVDFDDWKDFYDFKKNRSDLFESDIKPIYKFLSDHYYNTEADIPVNICYFDIEVDFDLKDGLGYPRPDNPFGEINAVSMFDVAKNEYHMVLFDTEANRAVQLKDPDGVSTVTLHYVEDERELLVTFGHLIDDCDIISAWNGDKFDIPYIIVRAQQYFGVNESLSLLCRDGFKASHHDAVDDFGNDFIKYDLVGRVHLDMLDVYKKFSYEVKKSYALDFIAEDELSETKVEYEDNLGTLYRTDPQTFFEYSLQDSRLLKMLNAKKRIIELLIQLARVSTIRFADVLRTVKMIEQRVINYCHFNDPSKRIVVPDKRDHPKETFPGGYVYPTIPGRYGWMASYDLTSLYPCVMMMLGLSSETFLFQLTDRFDDYIRVVSESDELVKMECVAQHIDYRDIQGDVFEMTGAEAMATIREEGWCISANGSIFRGDEGIISRVIRDGFDTRKFYKGLKKEAGENGDTEKEVLYDLYQQACKIVINSAFGAITNEHFRFFNLDLGKSITLTGQIISKAQMKMVNDTIEEAGLVYGEG